VFSTFVSVFSHVVGGGSLPGPAALAVTLSIALVVCLALTGRRSSLWRTVLSVSIAQFVFHSLFSSVGSVTVTSGDSVTTSPMNMAGHSSAVLAATGSTMPANHDAWMWLAHAAAAAITIAALQFGERAISAALASVDYVIRRVVSVASSIPPRPASVTLAVRERTELPADLLELFSALRHRGPPALATVA
jgi:hypothetical protein